MKTRSKLSLIAILTLLLSLSSCFQKSDNSTSSLSRKNAIFQSGADKEAMWLYLGFVPRVSKAKNLDLIISKKGFTLRAHATFSQKEIENYAQFLYDKYVQMTHLMEGFQMVKWKEYSGEKIYSVPFKIEEKEFFERYQENITQKIYPAIGTGFEQNLNLLKYYFRGGVTTEKSEKDGSIITHLHLVYPITTGKGKRSNPLANYNWLKQPPYEGTYEINWFQERRTLYTKAKKEGNKKMEHIFGGFPAFWFTSDGIGMHGPIRYTEDVDKFAEANDDFSTKTDKKISKKWQLVRTANSANCIRMEHLMEIRHLMPAQFTLSENQPKAQNVEIQVTDNFDFFDINFDGKKDIVGVNYYQTNPWEKSQDRMSDREYGNHRRKWIYTHYANKFSYDKRNNNQRACSNNDDCHFYHEYVYELEYRRTYTAQITPLQGYRADGSKTAGTNPTTRMAYLNRLPLPSEVFANISNSLNDQEVELEEIEEIELIEPQELNQENTQNNNQDNSSANTFDNSDFEIEIID